MPAELSFEQLTGKTTEEEVKEVFREAFLSVENAFLESIDPRIAERTQLLDKIPDGMSQFEAAQKFPETFSRLQVRIDFDRISSELVSPLYSSLKVLCKR